VRAVRRPVGVILAAVGLLLVDALVRLVAGGPYLGATFLLVGACGLALVRFLPRKLGTPSLLLALVPVVGLAAFALLLTTVSIVSIELTELSVRLAVLALVVVAAVVDALSGPPPHVEWPPQRELGAVVVLLAAFGLAFASSYDVVEPFPPPGTDWAHNLQYVDEVETQGSLLVYDPYASESSIFANPPGVGAVYGSLRILDGVSSPSLARGIAVLSALGVLSIYAAVGGLWGVTAGLLAAAAWAVAPIRLETMYWHGLATTLALAVLPLVLLGLGAVYRSRRDQRVVGLLGLSLAAIAVAHSASALVVGFAIALVLAAEVVRALFRLRHDTPARALRWWWRDGVTRPVLAAVGLAVLLGAATIVHLARQSNALGSPVSAGFFDNDWLDLDTLDYYFSWQLLALVGASLVLVLWGRERRSDPALAALAVLVAAAVVVSQLWRIDVPFEYRRVVYYVGPVLVALVGVASVGLGRRWIWVTVCAIAFVGVAQDSIGLRLPERLLEERESRSAKLDALAEFRAQLDRTDPDRRALLVADRCLGVRVPFAVRRRTLVSAEEWQAGYESLVDGARDATAIVEGGPEGRRLAEERGVDYVLADPACNPDLGTRLDGEVAFSNDELLVVRVG